MLSIVIALFIASVALQICAAYLFYQLLPRVNEKLPEERRFPLFTWDNALPWRVLREYGRAFPRSKRPVIILSLNMTSVALFLIALAMSIFRLS